MVSRCQKALQASLGWSSRRSRTQCALLTLLPKRRRSLQLRAAASNANQIAPSASECPALVSRPAEPIASGAYKPLAAIGVCAPAKAFRSAQSGDNFACECASNCKTTRRKIMLSHDARSQKCVRLCVGVCVCAAQIRAHTAEGRELRPSHCARVNQPLQPV